MSKKIAVLIGVSDDALGTQRSTAVKNAEAMQQVLTDPERGSFAAADVVVLRSPDRQTMAESIQRLYANCQPEDLVLLYLSGPAIVEGGEVYFAPGSLAPDQGEDQGRLVADTAVADTAVAARSIQSWMAQSRSQHQVVILDGYWRAGEQAGRVNLTQGLAAESTAILIASTSSQATPVAAGGESVYTHYLVEGLRTGAADADGDGAIGVEELHAYASRKVQQAAPALTPALYLPPSSQAMGLAKSPQADPRLAYRRQAEQWAHEGRFSFPARRALNQLRLQLGVRLEVADAIEAEVLQPYRDYQDRVAQYEQMRVKCLQSETPLSQKALAYLKAEQERLGLPDAAIAPGAPSPPPLPPPLPESRPSRLTRQRFLKWAGWGGGGLVLALVTDRLWQASRRPQVAKTPQLPPQPQLVESPQMAPRLGGLQLATVDFETVTVDTQGQVVERSPRQAASVKQDLGNGLGLEMVKIPKGEFLMGTAAVDRDTVIREMTRHGVSLAENPEKHKSQKDEAEGSVSWEIPQHSVKVPEFLLGRLAVTQAQWKQVAGFPRVKLDLNPNPSDFPGAERPVEQVSWDEAVEFCDRLSRATQKSYRLPSEAEWEYACRAGTTTPFHVGPTLTADLANCDGTYPYGQAPRSQYRAQTIEGGSFPPNGFGLYDLHGNVWEWCADTWHENYKGAPIDGKVWLGGNPDKRVVRGGSFVFNSVYCRTANRLCLTAGNQYVSLGFRVACSVPADLL
jgi:formylglycine-generating enzyme required for sulfatase activity/uncharacterized caspase-like protein